MAITVGAVALAWVLWQEDRSRSLASSQPVTESQGTS
jgi:hypothetical protein